MASAPSLAMVPLVATPAKVPLPHCGMLTLVATALLLLNVLCAPVTWLNAPLISQVALPLLLMATPFCTLIVNGCVGWPW